MNKTGRRTLALLLALCMLISLFAGLTLSAGAKYDGTISSESLTLGYLGKDGATVQPVKTWTWNADDETYYDSENDEIPGVVTAATEAEALWYSGSDNGNFARLILAKKYIPISALITCANSNMPFDVDGGSVVRFVSGADGFNNSGVFDATWGGTRYYSEKYLIAAGNASNSTSGIDTTAAGYFSDASAVVSVLAIQCYNERLSNLAASYPVTDANSLAALKTYLFGIADAANSLRLISGMDSAGVATGKHLNTGNGSSKGVNTMTIEPVYNAITVTSGAATGTEGESGYKYTAGNASVTTSDNWFKAAKGETVTLTVTGAAGFNVSSVTAAPTAGGDDLAVTPGEGGAYSFSMPGEAVTVTVATEAAPIHSVGDVTGKDSATWTGVLDFSWYDASDVKTSYHITTPAQWEALAWICSEHLGELTDAGYSTYTAGNITGIYGAVPSAQNTFEGVKFYLDNDIDMGGVYSGSAWSGKNYYPVGSQAANDAGTACWYGLFYGSFDGQGHTVKNIYCNRGVGTSYQSAGLFGRVGAADNTTYPAVNITIENVAVTGYISTGRSGGGIVGKTLHVASGYNITVKNCLNFADVITNNGSKGVGGVVGTLWNGAAVVNCANFGSVTGSYSSANAGGVSGSAEGPTSNSYNVGAVTNTDTAANVGALALNKANVNVTNCYALEGSAPGFTSSIVNGSTLVSGGWKTAAEMKTAGFAALLSGDDDYSWVLAEAADPINTLMTSKGAAGYPVPAVFSSYAPEYWNGAATDTSWYNTTDLVFTITTPAELAGFAAIVNGTDATFAQDNFSGKTVKLGGNIVLEEAGLYTSAVGTFGSSSYPMDSVTYYTVSAGAAIWTPIGSGTATSNINATTANAFAGTFDGQGYKVKGVYTDGAASVQGLFGVVSGTVKNVTVEGCVAGKFVVGGVVAHLAGGTVEGCVNNAVVYADGGQVANSGAETGGSRLGAVGGIVGNAMDGSAVKGCVNNGAVTCTNTAKGGRAGGIIGLIDGAYAVEISKNGNNGDVHAYQYSGGIVGMNGSASAPINACYNTGDIYGYSSGSTYVGGITATSKSNISNCYNTGKIEIHLNSSSGTKAAHFGGIISDFSGAAITNCYNTGALASSGTAVSQSSYGAICASGYGTAATNKLANCASTVSGQDTEAGCADFVTAAELKAAAGDLGVCFVAKSGNYPVLYWEAGVLPVEAVLLTTATDVYPGDLITVTMVLRAAEDTDISAFQAGFTFSDGVVTPVSGASAITGARVTFNGVSGATANLVSFTDYTGSVGASGTVVATLSFTAAEVGTAQFAVSSPVINKGESVSGVSIAAGQLSVPVLVDNRPVTLTGSLGFVPTGMQMLAYTAPNAPAQGSAYTYDGESMYYSPKLSDTANGKYVYLFIVGSGETVESASAKITETASTTQLAVAYGGNVNGDSAVNIVDAQIASDLANGGFASGLTPCTMVMRFEADVNGDGAVTGADARAIQYFIHYSTFTVPVD